MTNPEILDLKGDKLNKAIAEMIGMCWHEWEGHSSHMVCLSCGFKVPYHTRPPQNPDFASSLDTFHEHVVPWLEERGLWKDYVAYLKKVSGAYETDNCSDIKVNKITNAPECDENCMDSCYWSDFKLLKATATDHCHAALMAGRGEKG